MISIIIPTLWKVDRLYQTLKELEECKYVSEIILIDNTGEKKNIVNSKLIYVLETQNTYVNQSWNKGVNISKESKICILNDDIWFDWNNLNKISSFISNKIGLIGMSSDNYHIQSDSELKLIEIPPDWKTQKGHRPIGYGCCLFIHKDNWISIPNDMKIWAGDDYIFYYKNDLKNYIIDGLKCYGHMSATSDSSESFNPIKENDMMAMKEFVKNGIVENYLIGTIWE